MAGRARAFLRKYGKRIVVVYLLLLAVSHLYLQFLGAEESEAGEGEKSIEMAEGRLAYHEWGERGGVPLILSHGSPLVGGADFDAFAQELAKERWVIAPDRWGFGRSEKRVPDYSFVADARAMVALMDELEIPEADVMGWSYGGGVVLEMADRYPERVRSVGLLGAIGIQEGEGSGSYWMEHAKYRAVGLLAVVLPELVPHFGWAGERWLRYSFYRDFSDADQRPLREVLERLSQPVIIVQGEDDPLVMAWVAEAHHALLAKSRLLVLEGGHFFPMGGKGMPSAVEAVGGFLEDVEVGNDVSGANYEMARNNMKAIWAGGPSLRGYKPWWLVMGLAGAFAWWRPRLTLFLLATGGGLLLWDAVTGFVAVFAVLIGKKFLAKPPEKPRSRWFPLHVVFDMIAGSTVGGLLLAMF